MKKIMEKEILNTADAIFKLSEQVYNLKAENEKLKEDYMNLSQQKDLDNTRWQKRCTDLHIKDKAKADKYWLILQEIKEIAEKECKDCLDKRSDSCWICPYYPILDLITKAEEE